MGCVNGCAESPHAAAHRGQSQDRCGHQRQCLERHGLQYVPGAQNASDDRGLSPVCAAEGA